MNIFNYSTASSMASFVFLNSMRVIRYFFSLICGVSRLCNLKDCRYCLIYFLFSPYFLQYPCSLGNLISLFIFLFLLLHSTRCAFPLSFVFVCLLICKALMLRDQNPLLCNVLNKDSSERRTTHSVNRKELWEWWEKMIRLFRLLCFWRAGEDKIWDLWNLFPFIP